MPKSSVGDNDNLAPIIGNHKASSRDELGCWTFRLRYTSTPSKFIKTSLEVLCAARENGSHLQLSRLHVIFDQAMAFSTLR